MENLWRTCHEKYFFEPRHREQTNAWTVDASSRRVSLDPRRTQRKISRPFLRPDHYTVAIHRFEEIIGGRAYSIEVMPVSNRWRAQLVRTPGIPTAMMPFYGLTPDEAAKHLTEWLTLAHRRQAASTA